MAELETETRCHQSCKSAPIHLRRKSEIRIIISRHSIGHKLYCWDIDCTELSRMVLEDRWVVSHHLTRELLQEAEKCARNINVCENSWGKNVAAIFILNVVLHSPPSLLMSMYLCAGWNFITSNMELEKHLNFFFISSFLFNVFMVRSTLSLMFLILSFLSLFLHIVLLLSL